MESIRTSGDKTPTGITETKGLRVRTRCVSTLSPTQRVRKRAYDRKSQRAARQRAKDHVTSLEQCIHKLSQVDRTNIALPIELHHRNEQFDQALAELTVMPQLQSITSPILQLGGSHVDSSSITSPRDHYVLPPSELCQNAQIPYAPYQRPDGMDVLDANHINRREIHNGWTESSSLNSYFHHTASAHFAGIPLVVSNNNMPFESRQSPINFWEHSICSLPPTGIIDRLLISVIREQQDVNSVRTTADTYLAGPANMSYLLNYEHGGLSVYNPISQVIAQILNGTRMQHLPERAACLYIMHKLLSWQVLPLLETYEKIPEWFSPRISQLVEPHALWISHIPWPKLRDKVIGNQLKYATEEFQKHYHISLSLNWPYRDIDVLKFENGEISSTLRFEKHILNLENWSLDAPFAMRYPELADCCHFSARVVYRV